MTIVSKAKASTTALRITYERLPTAQVGQPYEATLSVSGNLEPVAGVYLDSGALPEGLFMSEFNEETASTTISGVPTEVGTFKFVLVAYCHVWINESNQTGQQHYEIKWNSCSISGTSEKALVVDLDLSIREVVVRSESRGSYLSQVAA